MPRARRPVESSGAPPADAPEALNSVETVEDDRVEVPSVGRIVHLRIDTNTDEEVLRPAIVLGRGDQGTFLHLQVMLYPHDLPLPPGARVRVFDKGYFARAPHGTDCGEWRWPEYVESVFFDA
jgi:hypothetical protein